MINARELRLFNWAEYKMEDGSWMPLQIIKLSIYELEREHVRPLALTPEILLACGFVKGKIKGVTRLVADLDDTDPADKKKYTYFWDLKVPKNDHVQDLSTFNLVQFGKGSDIFWGHQWLRVKVTSLHQLQNLYFALTGTELTYKP